MTLVEGSAATCTITNTAIDPTLTLIKVVDNGVSGGTAVPADWTLTALNGGSTISGPGGDPAVIGATAIAGTYALSEAGPAGYEASALDLFGSELEHRDLGDSRSGRERHLHDHQHGDRPDADARQGRRER